MYRTFGVSEPHADILLLAKRVFAPIKDPRVITIMKNLDSGSDTNSSKSELGANQ